VLSFSIWQYLSTAGINGSKAAKARRNRALRMFDDRVDELYFPLLWTSVNRAVEDARAYWAEELLPVATDVFEEFLRSEPAPRMRQVASRARGENAFQGAASHLRKNLQTVDHSHE